MSKQRKQYSAALKSKVALEAIKGVRSANEIARLSTLATSPATMSLSSVPASSI